MRWEDAMHLDVKEIVRELRTSPSGLSVSEVFERRARFGGNHINRHEASVWRIFVKQFRSSFIYLLLVASALSFLLGEAIEAEMMLLFIAINAILGFVQEYRSVKAIEALKEYLVSRVVVRRSGKEKTIESDDVTVGDVVVVRAGDKIAADMVFLECHGVMVDEEALTGESTAVEKSVGAVAPEMKQMHQAKGIGFAGTVVVRGSALGVVFATGNDTVMGDVAHLTEATNRESTFEKGMMRFSRFILRMVIVTLALIFLVNVLIKGEGANVAELLVFSIVLVVSVIPEALPLIITVSLSRGSLRLSRKKVVVKRLSAIEDLGSVEVLCSDKTGTLTENKLSVEKVFSDNREQCLYAAVLASDCDGLRRGDGADPFDTALWNAVCTKDREMLCSVRTIASIDFDPMRRRNSVMIEHAAAREIIVRGAPEAVLGLSDQLDSKDRERALLWMAAQGRDGRRVIAVARKAVSLRTTAYVEADESDMQFLGLISFVDPIKSTAKEAVDNARKLGVAVKIVTGDSREVSGSVAERIGLIASSHEVIIGEELDALSYEEKKAAVHRYSVFARVSPRQKYEIIQLLQETAEVGFLGEGINDAPALKLANVALVVQGASDIAREAADVILLDASLKVIIDGIEEGRSIFANMIKYIRVTLASNFVSTTP
jgi:Mg2+-importing ATPase